MKKPHYTLHVRSSNNALVWCVSHPFFGNVFRTSWTAVPDLALYLAADAHPMILAAMSFEPPSDYEQYGVRRF